jgi:hypothetical protein
VSWTKFKSQLRDYFVNLIVLVCPKIDVAVVVVTLVQVCNFVSVCFIKMEEFSVKKSGR